MIDDALTNRCACCGRWEGEQAFDVIVRLKRVQAMARRNVPEGAGLAFGYISLCASCERLMGLDLGGIFKEADRASVGGNAFDTILYHFLVTFIRDVWAGGGPPSWTDLCRVMNAGGLRTQKGVQWGFHNLRQKCERLNIDPKAIYSMRIPEVPAAVADWLQASMVATAGLPEYGPDHVRGWGETPQMPGIPSMPGDGEGDDNGE